MNTTLEVIKRSGKVGALRASGMIPGIVYGPKQEPIAISVDKQKFEKLMIEAGESTIIALTGLGAEVEVLIQDAAFDAARGGVDHVDFYAIERGKELTANVPLEFIGEAPVEKTGAMVTKVMHDIEVTCRPSKLPSHIDVDITVLHSVSDHILVKDLIIPEGVTVTPELDDVVVTVSAQRGAEPETVSEEPDMDAIEVEAKGKEETDGTEDKPETPAAE